MVNVVFFLGVVVAIAIPNFHEMILRAHATRIIGDFDTIRDAAQAYLAEYGVKPRDYYPWVGGLGTSPSPYPRGLRRTTSSAIFSKSSLKISLDTLGELV